MWYSIWKTIKGRSPIDTRNKICRRYSVSMKFRNTFDGLSEETDYELSEEEKMTLLNEKQKH